MMDSFGFARPVSPLLLWVMIEAGLSRSMARAVPPLLVSVSVGLMVAAKPLISIVSGVLGL